MQQETTRVLDAEERLRRIGRRINRLIERVQVSKGTETVWADLDKEFKRIDHHVNATRAQIAQDLAVTRGALARALDKELDAWRGRLDELEVQAALGRIEARQRLRPIITRIDLAIRQNRKNIEDLANGDVVDREGLERAVRMSMKDLRKDIDEAEELS